MAHREHGIAKLHGEGAIQALEDIDACLRIAPAAGARVELEQVRADPDRVVVGDGARILEAQRRLEHGASGTGPKRGRPLRGRLGEAAIEARQKRPQKGIGLVERPDVGEAEFLDEPILERAKEPLHPTFSLGRARRDPANAQVVQRAAHLRQAECIGELGRNGRGGTRLAPEDPVPVGVDGGRHAVAAQDLGEQQEVAMRVFLRAKDGPQHPTRRIVNCGEEHEVRSSGAEPRMMAAVELDEQAGLRHPRPPAAVPGRPAGAGPRDACLAQHAKHGRAGQREGMVLPEQIGQMVIVDPRVDRARQHHDLLPDHLRDPVGGGTSPIPMTYRGDTASPERRRKPLHMAMAEAEHLRRLGHRHGAPMDLRQDLHALLILLTQCDRLPGHSPRVT